MVNISFDTFTRLSACVKLASDFVTNFVYISVFFFNEIVVVLVCLFFIVFLGEAGGKEEGRYLDCEFYIYIFNVCE